MGKGKRTKKLRNKRLGPQNPAAREAAAASGPAPQPKQRVLPPEQRTVKYAGSLPAEKYLEELRQSAKDSGLPDDFYDHIDPTRIGRYPLFRYGRAKEGLGPHAEPVLRAVCDGELSGACMDEIGVATLYSPKRALKYLNGMRDVGLLEERDGVWYRTNITLDEAEYRSRERLNADAVAAP